MDLSQALGDGQLADIHRAFLDYQILYFREQKLSHRQYCDFAGRFGPLRDYMFIEGIAGYPYISEIVKTEDETESFGSFWHSDSTYVDRPPKITLLYAREVPPRGGDTLFSDMYALYRDLSPGLQSKLESLNAINSASVVPRADDFYQAVKGKNSELADAQAIHPVIRRHDETGRKAVYVNSIHTLRFDGMSREESLPLLNYLYQLVQRPEYCFRLQWRADTLAMWDNRCLQHYAVNDYHGYRRAMHRIIVEGDRPA